MDDLLAQPLQPFLYKTQRFHRAVDDWTYGYSPSMKTAYGLWSVLDGKAGYESELGSGSIRQFGPGSIIFHEPGSEMHVYKGCRIEFMIFDLVHRDRFYTEKNVKILEGAPAQPRWKELIGFTMPASLEGELGKEARDLIARLGHIYWRSRQDHLLANSELHNWLIRYLMARFDDKRDLQSDDDYCRHVDNLISERCATGLTVSDLAEILGISRSTLNTRYRNKRGIGPGQAIQRERIDLAKNILRGSEMRLEQVAVRAGYADQATFSRAFKTATGETPLRWRRHNSTMSEPPTEDGIDI